MAARLYAVLLAVAVTFYGFPVTEASSAATDAAALLSFKDAVSSDPFSLTASWTTENGLCDWAGIVCTEQRVTGLNFSLAGLEGLLVDQLQNLDRLTILSLNGNKLKGSIPSGLGGLKTLKILDLSENQLSGTLPSSLCSLTSLEYLDFSSNKLGQKLPEDIGNLTKLRYFNVRQNYFTGPIPESLWNMTFLETLDLSINSFTGEISPAVGNLKNVSNLMLNSNRLTGSIPLEITKCNASLSELDLSENFLSGNLTHIDWSIFANLYSFNMGDNNFYGPLPSGLGDIEGLTFLYLNLNNFSGPIPNDLSHLQNIQVIDMSDNPLNTTLNPNLSFCQTLETLLLNNASLYGTLPSQYYNWSSMVQLLLQDNNLSGELPEKFGACCFNVLLNFTNNLFEGSIPKSWVEDNEGFVTLWLSNNRLSGPLPEGFGRNSSLTEFHIDNNFISGPLPSPPSLSLRILSARNNLLNGSIPAKLFDGNVTLIDLSYNNLSGPIPSLGTNLNDLESLNLAHNMFNGTVPAALFQYRGLVTVDLSYNEISEISIPAEGNGNLTFLSLSNNHITSFPQAIAKFPKLASLEMSNNLMNGSIPSELATISSLNLLSLSNNSLTGGIPPEIGNLSLLSVLHLDRNSLSGSIPPSLGELTNLLELKLNHNFLSGEIPSSLGNLSRLTVLDLSSNSLNGSIPGILSGLDYLEEADFSSNFLSGPIPIGNLTVLNASSFSNNSALCDAPLPHCPPPPSKPYHLPAGAIAGIAIGAAIAGALFIILGGLLCLHLRRMGPDGGELVLYHSLPFTLTYKDLLKATDNWSESMLLGVGGFGSVYKGILSDGETIVAIKRLAQGSSQGVAELKMEVKVLGQLKHRNLVKLLGSYISEKEALLIYEFLPGGDLESYLYGDKKVFKEWVVRHNVLLGAAKGFKYLHLDVNPAVIHRDIKPPNILLDDNQESHVADFGLAREFDVNAATHLSTNVSGTVGYMALEYIQSGRLSTKTDVFAFGIVILQVVTGKRPTDRSIGEAGLAKWVSQLWIKNSAIEAVDPKMALSEDEVGQVLGTLKLGLMCTSRQPEDRPTMAEVVHLLEHIDMFDTKIE